MLKFYILLFQTSFLLLFFFSQKQKDLHLWGQKNSILSKNNILLFFIVCIQLKMILVALPPALPTKW